MIIVTSDSNLIGKRTKNPKEFAINGNIILKGHGTNHDDFSILLNESSVFKLHLKESLLIKKINQSSMEIIIAMPWSFLTGHFISVLLFFFSIINHFKDKQNIL